MLHLSTGFLSLLFDLVFAVVMLSIGGVTGWWLSRTSPDARKKETERAAEIMSKLGELATSMAEDVGEHTSRVHKINSDLSAVQASDHPNKEQMVLDSMAEILRSNERLQEQLATAEVRLQRQAAELETQAAVARTDALTTLCNRRALDDELQRRLAEWQRRHSVFSLVMLDVDHFKKFNDVHGHQAGDEVLRGVGRVLTNTMREMDMVARFGGEEFAIVLPVTNLTEGLRAAERARAAVAESTFTFEGLELKVAVSVGVAEVLDIDNVGTLVKRADAALYSAKGHGRNQVWYHNGEECRPAVTEKPAEAPAAQAAAPAPAPAKAAAPAKPAAGAEVVGTPDTPTAVFAADLRRRLLECQQYNVPLALMYVEPDDLPQVIGACGPVGGEALLKSLADLMTQALTEMDVVSRIGGRLVAMMPGTNLQNAVRAAEQVRTAAAATRSKVRGQEVRSTVSIGVTEVLAGDTPNSLSQRADGALLSSKAAGKNCTHAHDGSYCGLVRGMAPARPLNWTAPWRKPLLLESTHASSSSQEVERLWLDRTR